jgi:hypothetical protein
LPDPLPIVEELFLGKAKFPKEIPPVLNSEIDRAADESALI